MILWFSGTGNSRYVARQLAQRLKDEARSITAVSPDDVANALAVAANNNGSDAKGAAFGFVCPVYGWGLPPFVRQRLSALLAEATASRAFRAAKGTPFIYVVLTCGDDIGLTHVEATRLFAKYGLPVAAQWSLIMPDTYIALPGFDVDKPELMARKMKALPARMDAIAAAVGDRHRDVVDVFTGRFPWLKSRVLGPLFNALFVSDRPFRSTAACTGCRLCARVCPVHNITSLPNGRPHWNGRCTACMACYHHCPVHAISRGCSTRGKGQYLPPRN